MSRSVLIAEDNRVMADVLRFNLQRNGYEVVVAGDGKQAMELAYQRKFDLVLTDYQMPKASGEQLCEYLRALPEYADVPVLICSAKAFELDAEQLKHKLNISHVIRKPFSPSEVVKVIQETLELATASA